MKKWIALIMIAALTALTACTGSSADEKQMPVSNPNLNQEDEKPEINEENPDEGQPEGGLGLEHMVYGEVYEIIGNFITLKLIETPALNREGGGRLADLEGMTEEEIQERMNEFRANMGEGSFDPESMGERIANFDLEGMGEGMANFDLSSLGDGTFTMPEGAMQREVQYTGEQIDVIVPVGTSVVTTSWGESGMVETEIKLETVKAGDTLMINYDESDEKVIKVTLTSNLMGMMRGSGGMQRSQGAVTRP